MRKPGRVLTVAAAAILCLCRAWPPASGEALLSFVLSASVVHTLGFSPKAGMMPGRPN